MAAEKRTILRIEKLSHSFTSETGETTAALDNVSFSCKEGNFVCILGPSGCGKTTLLRSVAGLLKPRAGTVEINGSLVTGTRADVGFVFQEGPLFPWRNVLDNAAFALEVRGMASAERRKRARAVLDLVGMSRADEHKRPYELSGGMQQRVAIAQALAANPGLLLLDEPFANLDEVTSRRLQEELVRIWQASGKTVLFVTHLIEDAVFLGRRIIMMGGRPGRIVTEIETDLPYPRNRTDDLFAGRLLEVRRKFHEHTQS